MTFMFCFMTLQSFAEANLTMTPEVKKLMDQGLALEDKGDIPGAIKVNQQILKLQPTNYFAMNVIAGLYGQLGQFKDEATWAKKATAINPKFDLAYINYGNAMSGLGQDKAAETAFKKAVQLNPKSVFPLYNLGVLSDKKNNFTQSVEYYKKAIAIDPKFEGAYFNMGVAYANLKQYDKATAALKQALILNPNDLDAKHILDQINLDKSNHNT